MKNEALNLDEEMRKIEEQDKGSTSPKVEKKQSECTKPQEVKKNIATDSVEPLGVAKINGYTKEQIALIKRTVAKIPIM